VANDSDNKLWLYAINSISQSVGLYKGVRVAVRWLCGRKWLCIFTLEHSVVYVPILIYVNIEHFIEQVNAKYKW